MALESVRALFNGTWYTLTLDPSTGLYEGAISAPPVPADGIPITVRAVNSNGYYAESSTTIDVHWELVPPVAEITGPTEGGWYTNARQPVTFTLRDEEDGSGVNLPTLSFVLDGEALTSTAPGMVCTEADNGYDCTYTPPAALAEGSHTVSIAVKDVAGNKSDTVSLTWNIDTVNPALSVNYPPDNLVTNQPVQTITGTVEDTGIGLASLTINGKQVPLPGYQTGTVYLDGTAPADGDGTEASPYNDFELALRRAGDGGTILILGIVTLTEPATYNANVTIMPAPGVPPDGLISVDVDGEIVLAGMTILGEYDESKVAPGSWVMGGGAFSYQMTFPEGASTITVVATDKLGHTSAVERSLLVDTTPPVFRWAHIAPDMDAVPLGEKFVIRVVMADSFRPKAKETVTGTVNGAPVTFVEGPELTWTAIVPRADGDTYDVALIARDEAGNSTEYTVVFPCGMESKWDWKELDFLNFWDLNRIERNTEYIHLWLRERGYGYGDITIKKDWNEHDIPTQSDIDRIRKNVDKLQDSFFRIPDWMDIVYNTTVDSDQTNAIEWDLHLLDLWLDKAARTFKVYSGQIYSGMWPWKG